jgi:phosphate transport system protein
METHFDDQLKNLKQKLLQMAGIAQNMINLAVRSLSERQAELANQVLTIENRVNRMEVEIEEDVICLLACRQPAAKDLRLLVALLKINNDLERVADQAVNISETVLYLLQEPPLELSMVNIPGMAKLCQEMVKDSIESFIHHNPALAKQVCERDDEVDWMNHSVFRSLLAHMIENPKSITRAVDLILISRSLERVADHATNIGEEVIFIEQGKNIKHHLQEALPE